LFLTLARSVIPEIVLGTGIMLLKQSTEEWSDSYASVLCLQAKQNLWLWWIGNWHGSS